MFTAAAPAPKPAERPLWVRMPRSPSPSVIQQANFEGDVAPAPLMAPLVLDPRAHPRFGDKRLPSLTNASTLVGRGSSQSDPIEVPDQAFVDSDSDMEEATFQEDAMDTINDTHA